MVSDKIFELFWQGDFFFQFTITRYKLFFFKQKHDFCVDVRSYFCLNKQGWTKVVNLSLRYEWGMVI